MRCGCNRFLGHFLADPSSSPPRAPNRDRERVHAGRSVLEGQDYRYRHRPGPPMKSVRIFDLRSPRAPRPNRGRRSDNTVASPGLTISGFSRPDTAGTCSRRSPGRIWGPVWGLHFRWHAGNTPRRRLPARSEGNAAPQIGEKPGFTARGPEQKELRACVVETTRASAVPSRSC